MTVGELVEKLNKCPKDYNIDFVIKYQDLVDGDWRTMRTDDITSVESNEQNKSVTIITYE